MKLRQITEGATKLLIPVERELSKRDPVFFNPKMELSRDLSLVIAELVKPKIVGDVMAGCGARGIRIANELKYQVWLNDLNPKAYQLMQKNAELNNLSVDVTQKDANLLLSEKTFDWVDIDPFGSPARYVDSGFRAVNRGGVLAVTATDTSLFSGTYPKACRRKYDARPLRTHYYNELGLRIFLGFLARAGARHDKVSEILFSHCTRHYYRAYLQVEKSRKKADEMLKKEMKFLQHCPKCLNKEIKFLDELREKCQCNSKFKLAGPLWAGDFAQADFCRKMVKKLKKRGFPLKEEEIKLVKTIEKEQEIKNPYYDIHKVFKKLKIPAKPTDEVKKRLQSRKFKFSRTHFSPLGIRTEAKMLDLYDIFKE